MKIIALGLVLLLAGCAHVAGYAGKNPGGFYCKGKGVVTGTGSLQIGAGVGGGGSNAWTLQADCGESGFEFYQGVERTEDVQGKTWFRPIK